MKSAPTRFLLALCLLAAALPSAAQVNPDNCGDFSHVQWDYRTATPRQHKEVEGAHFPPIVENLVRGNRGYLGGDINYTLGASPNHHRALIAVMRYGQKLKTLHAHDMPYPVECYFIKGMRFAPDDHMVRLIYAQFLIAQTRNEEAAKQLEHVATMVTPENGFAFYNIGLLYSDMKDYERALTYAHRAEDAGFMREELRARLEKAGRWSDKAAAASAPSASAASAASPPAAASEPEPKD